MAQEHLTSEQMQHIAEEVMEHHKRSTDPEAWAISNVEHLYLLPVECYHVRYVDGFSLVFTRNEYGKLACADTWTYFAPGFHHGSGVQS